MPTTRKKVIKTVYKDDEDESAGEDFSDSGSEAEIPDHDSSDDEENSAVSSSEEFKEDPKPKRKKTFSKPTIKRNLAKTLISQINKQRSADTDEELTAAPALFSVKDLTDADKLLPSFLNLSESDSSDDESDKPQKNTSVNTSNVSSTMSNQTQDLDEEKQTSEYKDVFSSNIVDDSEEVARKTYMELERHKNQMEQTKLSIQQYEMKTGCQQASHSQETSINDLLALGEEVVPETKLPATKKSKKKKGDSDSEIEDWEEVNEAKGIPQQGLQLIVDFPDACRKKKTVDAEMMMRRKINRVKKEYQVYMHKVHVLCWLGHGNYISRVLNDQEVMAACITLVPSKECYPGERVDMKYVEQIITWYKDKLTLKQDKNEFKFKPKAPPLKEILLNQIKTKTVTTKKNLVLIFVSMLRALGLQCRVIFNFVTLPLKPPSSELCSLSTKKSDDKNKSSDKKENKTKSGKKTKKTIPQLDGIYDSYDSTDDSEHENILQLDGSNDPIPKTRSTRSNKNKVEDNIAPVDQTVVPRKRGRKAAVPKEEKSIEKATGSQEDISPPKRIRKSPSPRPRKKTEKEVAPKADNSSADNKISPPKRGRKSQSPKPVKLDSKTAPEDQIKDDESPPKRICRSPSPRVKSNKPETVVKTEVKPASRIRKNPNDNAKSNSIKETTTVKSSRSERVARRNERAPPDIIVTEDENISSQFFAGEKSTEKKTNLRTRSKTTVNNSLTTTEANENTKTRTRSALGTAVEKSKYFNTQNVKAKANKKLTAKEEDKLRVSHRDIEKTRPKPQNDITGDLIQIIKNRVKESIDNSKIGLVKGKKIKQESDEDSDFLPEEALKREADSDDDFKPAKVTPKSKSPRAGTSRKIDRRVLSTDDELAVVKTKSDVWCEVYVEELEQWVAVDVIKAKVHCVNEIYNRASHPVCYIVGWDNNNYLKDVTRRYVPHWNTVTRKLRTEPVWWQKAIQPWLGPKTARDREEDEGLDRLQLEAPLPTSIAEYKNHPLYALKRHLLKYEALYPPEAASLGFVRGEAVYSRECVYTCRSRDTWLKEAKVVRLGETPYKIVKARPKWDKLSNKCITDKPLEVFGPWQVDDYEPPEAKDGVVPRNAYGNVELFKTCMLPKGTVHLRLPGLNKVARNLNIDCAPAMTGFDFNGGWSHPVYDGFVVCQEFEEVITEAWLKEQEAQERKEQEKMEARVYGNWKKLIRGLFIRERLNDKYGFVNPTEPETKKKSKGPRLVVKKK